MFQFLSKLLSRVFRKPVTKPKSVFDALIVPSNKLDREIFYVSRSLSSCDFMIDEMNRKFREAGGICCPDCFYGGRYTDACDRRDRVALVLKRLLNKRVRRDLELQQKNARLV